MDLVIVHDKESIFNFLKEDSELQIYSIGDLDNFYWPNTIWYALKELERNKIEC